MAQITQQELASQNTRTVHSRFDQGMIRDIKPWMLPEGALYDAQDVLCDKVGTIRKRGGILPPTSATNLTAIGENLTAYQSGGVDGISGLWCTLGRSGISVSTINKGTGAATTILTDGSNQTIACDPFQFGNLLVFPFSPTPPGTTTSDRNRLIFGGGGTGANFLPTAATIVANDNRITAVAPTSFVAAHVGCIIELDNSTGANTNYYIGRIVEVTTTSSIRVEPTPQFGFTATSGQVTAAWDGATVLGVGDVYTGRFGAAFQNRVVMGYTSHTQGNSLANYAKGIDLQPNRLIWTSLPTEPITTIHGAQCDGNGVLYPPTITAFNYQDIPNLGNMTGLANLGDGQLVIFGPRSMFVLSGNLTTETIANNSIAYSVDQASSNVGCVSSRSIRYARGGILFAGYDNIYYWNGSTPQPILNGRNQRYYQGRISANNVIYGSAYFTTQNHYYLSMSGTDGGLLINLDDGYPTVRLTGPCTQIFDSASDPIFPQTIWSMRWWDTLGSAPTMVKGQLNQIDPIFSPSSTNKADADGTSVLFDLQTAAYVDGRIGVNKLPTDLNMTYKLVGTGSPTLTLKADTKLDTADASYVTIDSAVIAQATSTTKDFETGALLPDGQAVQYRLTGNATCDSFELDALDIGTHQGPAGFST